MDIPQQLSSALTSRYLVKREIGAGGMATVYLAEDVKHGRPVALKVLKPEIGAVLGVDRFLAEIRVTATLQHPNLLPLFDSGEVDGFLYYVMPFVDGESLRAKLDRERQLPIDEALHIASAVASALEYAHGHGVIHRDLKPENILMQASEPVVADFGIALAVSVAGGARITQTGLSLGTPQYMSPEQATGDRAIDRRTDVYSLGAVTYEMLTGEPPHLGSTVQALIARVLTERPQDVRVLRPSVPDHVALAVARALEKLPADRWSTAREFAEALLGRAVPTLTRRADAGIIGKRFRWLGVTSVVLALIALTLGGLLIGSRTRATNLQPDVEFTMTPLPGTHTEALQLALSPDGRTFAFSANATPGGEGPLMVREWGVRASRSLPGTVGAMRPFFSPDGQWIGYWSDGRFWRISTRGGERSELLSVPQPARGTWLRDGTLIYASVGGIYGAKPGAPAKLIAAPDTAHGELRIFGTMVLRDERTIVYSSFRPVGVYAAQLGVMSIDGNFRALLPMKGLLACLGMIDDWLIAVRADGGLVAIPFDIHRREVVGPAIALDENISHVAWAVAAVMSTGGTLLYGEGGTTTDLVWVNEHGVTRPLLSRQQFYDLPRLSPDGTRLAVHISPSLGRESVGDYWVYEMATTTLTRLTTDSSSYYGQWLDNRTFVHAQGKDSTWALVRRRVDGSESPLTVLRDNQQHYFEVTPGGRSLLYANTVRRGKTDYLLARSLTGDSTARPIAGIPDGEAPSAFRVSPDGKWLAYSSVQSGVEQIYLRPFNAPGPRLQVSSDGGVEPVWSRDGHRIFYRTDDGHAIWAATLTTTSAPSVLSRTKLFEGNFDWDDDVADYDVSASGEFVMVRFPQPTDEVVVSLNWADRVRQKLHGRR